MFNANTKEILSLLFAVKYTHTKYDTYDYSNNPRPCHNFVFMLEGEGVIITQDKRIPLRAGDILFIPKNTTYISHWLAQPKVVFHSLHFSFQPKTDPLLHHNIPIQLLPNGQFDALYALLKNIERYQFSKDIHSFLALSAFYELCGKLLCAITLLPARQMNKTILPALQYIERHYRSQISVESLASLCFISPSRFYYLFKQQTGVSPIVYKNQVAIQRAVQELLSNKEESIANIAKRHGFASLIYFERLFKKMMGKSPSLYRKENALL